MLSTIHPLYSLYPKILPRQFIQPIFGPRAVKPPTHSLPPKSPLFLSIRPPSSFSYSSICLIPPTHFFLLLFFSILSTSTLTPRLILFFTLLPPRNTRSFGILDWTRHSLDKTILLANIHKISNNRFTDIRFSNQFCFPFSEQATRTLYIRERRIAGAETTHGILINHQDFATLLGGQGVQTSLSRAQPLSILIYIANPRIPRVTFYHPTMRLFSFIFRGVTALVASTHVVNAITIDINSPGKWQIVVQPTLTRTNQTMQHPSNQQQAKLHTT